MSKELVVSQKDFSEVGINAQLSTNDLVEVVANDIYDKFLDSVNDTMKKGKILIEKYNKLFDVELKKMKFSLKNYFSKDEITETVEEDDFDEDMYEGNIQQTFGKFDSYWYGGISIKSISLTERDRGTFVEVGNRNLSMPSIKEKSAKVKLSISNGGKNELQDVVVGKIKGTIETNVKKNFYQVITVPVTRFKNLQDEVKVYNDEVDALLKFLPKNRMLSVEKFTREARVKMNKKIISSQSPDFRNKMSELFQIKL